MDMDTEGPVDGRGCVACIGVFDGVHRGHQALLAIARERADAVGLPLVAITFDPHPMAVVGPRSAPPSLADVDARRGLLHQAGADAVDVLHFDERTSQLSPDEFVEQMLVERLHVRIVVVGADFRFGRGAAGSVATLVDLGGRLGFEVDAVPLQGEEGHRWSSTSIRELLAAGDVAGAADALGRAYFLDGTVVHGDHRGRELGFPTANLDGTPGAAIPTDGVYAGWLRTGDDALPAAISVGTNPTFSGVERRVESYVLDRDDLDLYGQRIRVEFVARLRPMVAFTSVDDLVVQMHADVAAAREILSPGR
jgi:riboflavin kinase/FMN adenylyltransferase